MRRISSRAPNAEPTPSNRCDHEATVVKQFTPTDYTAGLPLGAAVVQIDLDSTGKLMNAKLVRTSGFADLAGVTVRLLHYGALHKDIRTPREKQLASPRASLP